MSINIKLSDKDEDSAAFHDYQYENDGVGGNREETIFSLSNVSGNGFDISLGYIRQNLKTGKWDTIWEQASEIDKVKIMFNGAIEKNSFLDMLQLILDAEKIASIIK